MKAEMLLPLLLGLVACGGGTSAAPPAEPPPASPPQTAETPPEAPPAAKAPSAESAAPAQATSPALASSGSSSTPAKVEFPPHATVDQAIKAVPQGTPRINMADDALRAPLLELKRYDKCKIPRSTKVTMTVAVYDGAAVGLDLTTKPKNAKMEECIDEVVRGMTWTKVPSLNTVNVNF
jgi:hypothetical protein